MTPRRRFLLLAGLLAGFFVGRHGHAKAQAASDSLWKGYRVKGVINHNDNTTGEYLAGCDLTNRSAPAGSHIMILVLEFALVDTLAAQAVERETGRFLLVKEHWTYLRQEGPQADSVILRDDRGITRRPAPTVDKRGQTTRSGWALTVKFDKNWKKGMTCAGFIVDQYIDPNAVTVTLAGKPVPLTIRVKQRKPRPPPAD